MSRRKVFDYSNTCLGNNALDNTLGSANGNVAIGTNALTNNTSGDENVGIGFQSLMDNINGNYNISVGTNALSSLTNGSRNTALGNNAGNIITGSGNLFIGNNAGSSLSNTQNDILVISNSLTNNLIIGDFQQQKVGFCYGNGSYTGALSGDISIDGEINRTLTVERHLTSFGRNLVLSGGGGAIGSVNSDGGDLLFKTGVSTGTGSAKMVFSLTENIASSTIDNTFTDRMMILPPKKLSIIKSVAVQNPLFIINVPVNTTAAGSFELGISISTSSDFQSHQDNYMYSITNKAGTLSTNFSNSGAVITQTSGLLNVTMVFVNSTNQVIVRLTINVGAIAGTLTNSYAYVSIRNNSRSSFTLYD